MGWNQLQFDEYISRKEVPHEFYGSEVDFGISWVGYITNSLWNHKLFENHIFSRIINYKLNDFYKSTVSLSLTSFLSQLIVFVGTPLITRIYSPEDFADVSILSALIQCLGVFATLRYDNAIPLCDSEEEAYSLFIICSIFNIVFSISIFFLLLLMRKIDFIFFTLKIKIISCLCQLAFLYMDL